VVAIAARLKGLANRICEVTAGRSTHPVSLQVGGVARLPDTAKLRALRGELLGCEPDLSATADLFRAFSIPDFERETEFVSLKGETDYPWIGGRLVSTDGVEKPEREYLGMTNEFVVDGSTSKWCKLSRESFAVGALARVNINHRLLRPEARELAEGLGLRPVCHNPFMHNVARLVECVHIVHESVALIDEILEIPPSTPLMAAVVPRAGEGVGAVEAPRGILYHHYVYDEAGDVRKANCVIPTTQNHKNIHDDLPHLARRYAVQGMTDQKLELMCSMLVRAYDPCISCSVH
jgi:coenzyme F420-reducing hydrogenase alpha subunit